MTTRKDKASKSIGLNRTGIQASPIDARRTIEGAEQGTPAPVADLSGLAQEASHYAKSGGAIGTMPPPGTIKGAAKSFVTALKGENANVLLDKLGERLAFERTGSRLYEGALTKLEAYGSWPGGPTREALEHILSEELGHFDLLKAAVEALGGDPTALTPSADVSAVTSMGVGQVVGDARMDLAQTLEAINVAELADNDGWDRLIELCRGMGQDAYADRFEQALENEREHLVMVRGWLSTSAAKAAGYEPEVRVPQTGVSTTEAPI